MQIPTPQLAAVQGIQEQLGGAFSGRLLSYRPLERLPAIAAVCLGAGFARGDWPSKDAQPPQQHNWGPQIPLR